MNTARKTEHLPDSELTVMRLIWKKEEMVGSGELAELLKEEKGWSRSTVQALLARLEEKGFVRCERKGRIKLYSPLLEKNTYLKSETKNFLEQFYDNSGKKLIASLVSEEELTKKDLQELLDILD